MVQKLAFHIFDLILYNAYILFKLVKNNKDLRFRVFRKNLIAQILLKYKLDRIRRPRKMSANLSRLKGRHFLSVIPKKNSDDVLYIKKPQKLLLNVKKPFMNVNTVM